jgi:hypothetical protein
MDRCIQKFESLEKKRESLTHGEFPHKEEAQRVFDIGIWLRRDRMPKIEIDPKGILEKAPGTETLLEKAALLHFRINHEAIREIELRQFSQLHGFTIGEAWPSNVAGIGGLLHEKLEGDGVQLGAVVNRPNAQAFGGLKGEEIAAFGAHKEGGRIA